MFTEKSSIHLHACVHVHVVFMSDHAWACAGQGPGLSTFRDQLYNLCIFGGPTIQTYEGPQGPGIWDHAPEIRYRIIPSPKFKAYVLRLLSVHVIGEYVGLGLRLGLELGSSKAVGLVELRPIRYLLWGMYCT